MVRIFKHIFIAALLGISIMMPARELPSLPAEKNIRTGTLQNGIRYYLVASSAKKGFADFALVRKGEIPTELTAAQMRGLENFPGTTPESFLIRNGIGAGWNGYYEEWDGSTLFRFPDVPMYNRSVADSTLLLTFALVAESPAPQAIVIAGDISHEDILRRMDLFSLSVPKMHREEVEEEYVWEPYISPSFVLKTLKDTDEALVSVSYFAPRTPRRYMATAQPVVMNIFAGEFEVLVRERVRRKLLAAQVPFSSIDVDFLQSTETSGNVKYTISVGTDKTHIDAAMEAISMTVSSLAAFGAVWEDFDQARRSLGPQLRRKARSVPTNREYVHRCVRSCLYGSSLASRSEAYRVYARHASMDTAALGFFNRLSASFLNPSANADICYEAPLDTLDDLEAFFRYNLNYLKGSAMTPDTLFGTVGADSSRLAGIPAKVKLRKEGTDPVAGASLWTFSNGFRVFYYPLKGMDGLSYSFVLPEGYSSAGNLLPGESGYFTDLLSLYKSGGLPAERFYGILRAAGIEMTPEVGICATTFSGTVPLSRLPLLFRALTTLRTESEPDPEAFRIYCEGEKLRLESRKGAAYCVDAKLSESIHPGNAYTGYKSSDALTEDLYGKADRFFRERLFKEMTGGYLVLAGDADPAALKKTLCSLLGGLGVKPSASVIGRTLQYDTDSGRHFLRGKDLTDKVHMRAECVFPLTGKTWYMVPMVEEAVRRIAVRAAGTRARNLRVRCGLSPYPQERLNLSLSFDLAEGPAEEVMVDIRRALDRKDAVTEEDVRALRGLAQGLAEDSFKTPEGVIRLVTMRYTYNKDLKTRYKENIQSIARGDVVSALDALYNGSWAMYSGYGE